jgi:glycosyltransferase involved in cell wall biosynthesis
MKNNFKKIKISFLMPVLGMGGAEQFLINLVNNLDKNKFQVNIVSGNLNGQLLGRVEKGVEVINLNESKIYRYPIKIAKYLETEDPDIFVSFFSHINIASIIAKILSRSRAKLILCERTTVSRIFLTTNNLFKKTILRYCLPILIKIFYKKADAIICVSEGVAGDLSKIIGSPDKIKTIYNFIDINKIKKISLESTESKILEICPFVIAVGRLVKAKDYPTLIEAFSIVCKKQNVNLVIIGGGVEENNLKELVKKNGVSDKILFLGTKENPYKYMKSSELLVSSSVREGFLNVLVEAMACGIPVISTDCQSGPNEIIQNGENGILVPIKDKKILAAAILELLENKNLRRKFSEAGKKAAEKFSLENGIKNYEKLFVDILE